MDSFVTNGDIADSYQPSIELQDFAPTPANTSSLTNGLAAPPRQRKRDRFNDIMSYVMIALIVGGIVALIFVSLYINSPKYIGNYVPIHPGPGRYPFPKSTTTLTPSSTIMQSLKTHGLQIRETLLAEASKRSEGGLTMKIVGISFGIVFALLSLGLVGMYYFSGWHRFGGRWLNWTYS